MSKLLEWQDRSKEIAYLLNPAFCGRILHATVEGYIKRCSKEFPVPLVYLVLPLVLHTATRKTINSRSYLTVWVDKNKLLLLNYPDRCRDYVEITTEALEYMLCAGFIKLTENSGLVAKKIPTKLNKELHDDLEISECILKAKNVAKWFAQAGKTENVYVALGVRP